MRRHATFAGIFLAIGMLLGMALVSYLDHRSDLNPSEQARLTELAEALDTGVRNANDSADDGDRFYMMLGAVPAADMTRLDPLRGKVVSAANLLQGNIKDLKYELERLEPTHSSGPWVQEQKRLYQKLYSAQIALLNNIITQRNLATLASL